MWLLLPSLSPWKQLQAAAPFLNPQLVCLLCLLCLLLAVLTLLRPPPHRCPRWARRETTSRGSGG